jgi:hypothetical protein
MCKRELDKRASLYQWQFHATLCHHIVAKWAACYKPLLIPSLKGPPVSPHGTLPGRQAETKNVVEMISNAFYWAMLWHSRLFIDFDANHDERRFNT